MKRPVQGKGKRLISKFLNYHNKILKSMTFVLYLAFVLIGFGQIIWRYILNQPVTWVEQLSRYMFICSVFLGSALVIGTSEHIALEFFV